jgi:hypothetical protein
LFLGGIMGEFVTHEELKSALEVERGHTKKIIAEAVEDVASVQTVILNDLRSSMRDVQRDSARAVAVCDHLKEVQNDRFDEMKKLIEAHDGPIRRLRTYESIAVAGVNLVGGLPVWKWLRSGITALLAVISGVGLGMFLFMIMWG